MASLETFSELLFQQKTNIVENIFTKETASTPEIFCNLKQGIIKLKGVSLPEDSESFYQELFDFLETNHDELSNKPLNVSLMFLYLNTSSSAIISRLLQALEKIDNGKANVFLKWYFEQEDEDMKDMGNDYKNISTLSNFEIIPIDEI